MAADAQGAETDIQAQRLRILIERMHPTGRGPFTSAEIADRAHEQTGGHAASIEVIDETLAGRHRLSIAEADAIGRALGVHPDYFGPYPFPVKLDHLFRVSVNPATGKPWSNAQCAAACSQAGTSLTATHVGALRREGGNPQKSTIEALGRAFDKEPGYLLDHDPELIARDLHAFELTSNTGLNKILARALLLSEPKRDLMIQLMDSMLPGSGEK